LSNCSSYQNKYWYPRVAEEQHGEYCRGCGVEANDKSLPTNLLLDKINNDGDHTIKNNSVKDFQLLCHHCNKIKNPSPKPEDREMTQSEKTNLRSEKPLMEWCMAEIRSSKDGQIKFDYFVSEGSFKFDISPETIERRYYKKYLSVNAVSSPFTLWTDQFNVTYILLKNRESIESILDIDTHTPTPLLRDESD